MQELCPTIPDDLSGALSSPSQGLPALYVLTWHTSNGAVLRSTYGYVGSEVDLRALGLPLPGRSVGLRHAFSWRFFSGLW